MTGLLIRAVTYVAANQESEFPDLPISQIVEEFLPGDFLGNCIAAVPSNASKNDRDFVFPKERTPPDEARLCS